LIVDGEAHARTGTRRLAPTTARFRILAWCTLLVAGALAASVLTTRAVLLRRLAKEIDTELQHEIDEVSALQHTRVDPVTRQPIVDNDQLLLAALSQAAPLRDQELIALSDGKVIRRSPTVPKVALETDRRLVAQWASVTRPTFGTISTPAGPVRYLAAPVSLQPITGPVSNVFVAASFTAGERSSVDHTVGVAAAVGAFALLGAIGLAWLIAGRVLAPVRALDRTARSISESDFTHRIDVRGDDELARLAGTFNAMLDRLEGAFRSQRQFIDDAGHELRTPITVIRGHLELLGDDPGERAETRALLLGELDRMSRMVDDLLLLARAERPDFLKCGDVDVDTLTREIQVKAAALADRRWLDGGHTDAALVCDHHRITQAVMQLADNAVDHTEPGDVIEIGSSADNGTVTLWVADSGPGVPTKQRDAVFERFARPQNDARNGEHAGLGLAIVRAIADAHHGTVAVTTSRFGGACFTLSLPHSTTASVS
jgi:signal transduction histidine kinase